MAPRSASVNLKYLSEFNKYMMALGAAAFLYFDKFEAGFRTLRTGGAILSTLAVVIGVVIMSVLGRIHGDDIDYEHETDQNKILLFRIISRALLGDIRRIEMLRCDSTGGQGRATVRHETAGVHCPLRWRSARTVGCGARAAGRASAAG